MSFTFRSLCSLSVLSTIHLFSSTFSSFRSIHLFQFPNPLLPHSNFAFPLFFSSTFLPRALFPLCRVLPPFYPQHFPLLLSPTFLHLTKPQPHFLPPPHHITKFLHPPSSFHPSPIVHVVRGTEEGDGNAFHLRRIWVGPAS